MLLGTSAAYPLEGLQPAPQFWFMLYFTAVQLVGEWDY